MQLTLKLQDLFNGKGILAARVAFSFQQRVFLLKETEYEKWIFFFVATNLSLPLNSWVVQVFLLLQRRTGAVVQRFSVKKVFLKISQSEHLCQSLFFKNIFFYRTPLVAASGHIMLALKCLIYNVWSWMFVGVLDKHLRRVHRVSIWD